MTARAAGLAANLRVYLRCWRHAWRRDVLGEAYNTIPRDGETAGWDKPPAPGRPPSPAPGHHRGSHMVIDLWECGCLYTWTRAAGWVREVDCLDEQIRRLLTP